MQTGQINQTSPAVEVGVKVKVVINGQAQSWQIVSPGQSDLVTGKIASDAPVVRLLLGHCAGEEVCGEIHGRPVALRVEEVLIS